MTLKESIKRYPFVLLFPIVLVLPLPLIVSSIGLGLAVINLLIIRYKDFSRESIITTLKNPLVLLLSITFFLDILTGVFRSFDFHFTVREVRIPFLVIPACLLLARQGLDEVKEYVLLFFVLGVLLHLIYADMYLVYFYNYVAVVDFNFDHYLKYSYNNTPGTYHHTYQGLYMCFGIVISSFLSFFKRLIPKKMSILVSVLIFAHMLFMAGKLTLILAILSIGVMTFVYLKQTKYLKVKHYIYLLPIIGSLITVFYFLSKNKIYDSIFFSFSNRLESWNCSFEIFKSNPLFGMNHHYVFDSLKECMTTNAISTHNQFFDELLNYGVFSIWLPLFFGIIWANSKSNILFKTFIGLIFFISLYENIFSLQRGVLFIMFFYPVLINSKTTYNNKT